MAILIQHDFNSSAVMGFTSWFFSPFTVNLFLSQQIEAAVVKSAEEVMYLCSKPHVLHGWIRCFEFVWYLERWWFQVLNIYKVILVSLVKSIKLKAVFFHCVSAVFNENEHANASYNGAWIENPQVNVWINTAAPAGVKNCCVNNCCIILSVCTVWMNKLTALPNLCYYVKTLWVFYVFVFYIMERFKSLYFLFCNIFKGICVLNCTDVIAVVWGGLISI